MAGALLAVSGCRTLGYYAQAIQGQYRILARQKAIPQLLQDPRTPETLRQRFVLVEQLRAFAADHLKLPVNGHYRKYCDVERPFVLWNVEAAPELSMQPKTWWYPVVGRLEYRGYFSLRGATNYAAALRRQGYDVRVGGVTAYSTLGWFKDPVLNTFVFEPDTDLAETIFHELAHQRLFAHGDTDFDEAFATTVGQEGVRRWLKAAGNTAALEAYETQLEHTAQFARLIQDTRSRLEQLFGDVRDGNGRTHASKNPRHIAPDQLRREKAAIYAELKAQYARLSLQWNGDTEYDAWFARELNNAHLNSVATYYDLVPAFERLLARNGGDLDKFYAAAHHLAKQPKKERHELLTER